MERIRKWKVSQNTTKQKFRSVPAEENLDVDRSEVPEQPITRRRTAMLGCSSACFRSSGGGQSRGAARPLGRTDLPCQTGCRWMAPCWLHLI